MAIADKSRHVVEIGGVCPFTKRLTRSGPLRGTRQCKWDGNKDVDQVEVGFSGQFLQCRRIWARYSGPYGSKIGHG